MPIRFHARGIVLAVVAFLLLASFLYSRAVRDAYLTPDLRYLPKENALAVVTGDLRSLWLAVDDHFGAVIRGAEDREPGFLSELFGEWREMLDGLDLPVVELEDLTRYGLDVDRGALLGLTELKSEELPIAVVHLKNRTAFLEAFARLTELEPAGEEATESARIIAFGEDEAHVALVHPDGPAIVAAEWSELALRRASGSGDSNLRHALENDPLYDGVREHLRRPLGAGPAIYLFWRPRDLPGVEEVVGALTLSETELVLRIDARVRRDLLAVADRLFEPNTERVAWSRHLAPETLGVLVIEDRAVPGYLRFLALSERARDAMAETYGGILHELSRLNRLDRVLLAATGYRDGLPELLMGFWGEAAELGDLVDRLQARHGTKAEAVRYGDHTFEYLLPPTDDDDPEVLRTDRYRLATTLIDDVLWVATDARELEAVIDRQGGEGDDITANSTFRAAAAEWQGNEKLTAFVDVDRVTTLGLLSPESEIHESARSVLLDLRDHPSVSVSLRATSAERTASRYRCVCCAPRRW